MNKKGRDTNMRIEKKSTRLILVMMNHSFCLREAFHGWEDELILDPEPLCPSYIPFPYVYLEQHQ